MSRADLETRLAAARQRLQAALLAGQNTEPHRAAVAAAEHALSDFEQRQQDEATQRQQDAAQNIASRTAALAASVHADIEAAAAPFAFHEDTHA